ISKKKGRLLIPVDPGRRDLIFAVHPITGRTFRWSKKHHREQTGAIWFQRRLKQLQAERKKDDKHFNEATEEWASTSMKTTKEEELFKAIDTRQAALPALLAFWASDQVKLLGLERHRRKQRGEAQLLNAFSAFVLGDALCYQL